MVADYCRGLRDSQEVQTPSHLKESTSPRPIRAIHSLFSPSQGQQCSFPFSGSYPVTITDSSGQSDTSEVFRLFYPRYLVMIYLHCFRRIADTLLKRKWCKWRQMWCWKSCETWSEVKKKVIGSVIRRFFLQLCELLTGKPIKNIKRVKIWGVQIKQF